MLFDQYYAPQALFFVLLPLVCSCSERDVVASIFANYNKLVRPVVHQNTTIDVQLELRVFNIISINEPDESISLLLWTTALWYDEFLTWDPTEFDGCTTVKIHADQIWLPDIYFVNSLEITPIASSDINFISIGNDGLIRLALKYNANLRCSMAIDEFPFDTQHCPITVGLWTYNYTELVLHLRYPVNGLASYNGDPNFAPIMGAVEAEVTVGRQSYAELHYTIGLKRRPQYYVYVLLIPTFLLTSLCIIGIFTPNSNVNERNERVTLGLTTLLSMAVILNIVATEMPKGSKNLPLLGIFVMFEIGVCTLAIILSTIIIITHQRSLSREWKPTKFCYWIAQKRFPQTIPGVSSNTDKRKFGVSTVEETLENSYNQTADKEVGRQISSLQESFSKARAAIEKIDNRLQKYEEKEYHELIWQICFDMIDVLLLAFLLLINAGVAYILVR